MMRERVWLSRAAKSSATSLVLHAAAPTKGRAIRCKVAPEIAARSSAIFSKARKCFFKKIVRRTVRSACLTDKQLNRLQNNVALREIVSALEGDELEPVNVFPP